MRTLPQSLDALNDLALDLRWNSGHHADDLWIAIDEAAWRQTRNPWLVLRNASDERLRELAASPAFRALLARSADERRQYLERPSWFDETYRTGVGGSIAYFSMEFGTMPALPIYAGGLGILAGDVLKAAGDLGVPMIGVGLLYQRGYFRQAIDAQGEQRETYPRTDPQTLPIVPVLDGTQTQVEVELAFPGRAVRARVWEARVGRVPLYLLDTGHPANSPADRAITAELYGGDREMRIRQEIVLGIGGSRLLEQLRTDTAFYHLNEGHAAFAVLERARAHAARGGHSFVESLRALRPATLFTTHTAVAAGFDCFEPALVTKYFRAYARELGITPKQLLALGRAPGDGNDAPFNMAYLATNACGAVNAVSALHERVSRPIFHPLFDGPVQDVPISHVTNGVHVPTWSAIAPQTMSDEELWSIRQDARARLARRFGLEPQAMIVAFARRFTEYKRVTLLLRDPERLLRLLNDPKRPVQLLVAGKAHPHDTQGKAAVHEWVEFTRRPGAQSRALFIPDYEIGIASALTQGADLWLNTPRRPWEACGTSGMKALMNGVLNCSTLDGWWDEAYTPDAGWALGGRDEEAGDDEADAQQLYAMLEREIVPAFYERDARGIPLAWTAKMRTGLAELAPRFSAERMVCEYVDGYYASGTRQSQLTRPAISETQRRAAR